MIDPASVAFDIDGVIADTMSLFIDIARDAYNIKGIRYEDITAYNLADCLRMDQEVIDAVVDRILNGAYTTPLKPIDGAAEILTRIGQHYAPILFVTARPHLGPIEDWILELLSLQPHSIDVVAAGSFNKKAEVLLKHNISYFVEDRLETCFHIQNAGVVPILYKQPWNREPHPFVEVGSWQELESLIAY
ncbi:MAG: haloacid dehalogenase [Desulfobacterales bacterium]|nr:haloacid dehalogenase [Desulfobacterales bacterium]